MNSLILYEPRNYTLYAHVNKINRKIYFGITKARVRDRWEKGNGYKKGTKIRNAIIKYGWDNFYHIIVMKGLTYKEALMNEENYIRIYRTQDSLYGYNTDKGGKGGCLNAEARRKLKEKECMKSVIHLETLTIYETATEAALTLNLVPSSVMKACSSKRYVLFNEHFMHYSEYLQKTEEEIKLIMKMTPKCVYKDNRKVIALETKEIFSNAKDAQKRYSTTNTGSILSCCRRNNNSRYTAGGVHWMFLKEYETCSEEFVRSVLLKKNGRRLSKPVIRIDTGKIYSSLTEAEKGTGISCKTIRRACTKSDKTHKECGMWMFLNEYEAEKIDKK